jgi:hypothetical protein
MLTIVETGLLVSCSYDRRVIVWRETGPDSWEMSFVYEAHELSGTCMLLLRLLHLVPTS